MTTGLLLGCRPEFTHALVEECRHKESSAAEPLQPGLVMLAQTQALTGRETIFERFRLRHPTLISPEKLQPVSPETAAIILGPAHAAKPLWTVVFHALEEGGEHDDDAPPTITSSRIDGMWKAVLRAGRKTAPDLEKRFRPPRRLKPGGCVVRILPGRDGWYVAHEEADDAPLELVRMKRDPLAPSRSNLKIEEALSQMGISPAAGERVIDLGAAPGGWTYAFIRRGCDVIAVDHGPMKLPAHQEGWGPVRHVRANGITYTPPPDWPGVDWLIADMLIAPGVALGLLRRWLHPGRAKHIICNIKLPQEHPYPAVRPVEQLIDEAAGHFNTRIKQLYHDRREITVMASANRQ